MKPQTRGGKFVVFLPKQNLIAYDILQKNVFFEKKEELFPVWDNSLDKRSEARTYKSHLLLHDKSLRNFLESKTVWNRFIELRERPKRFHLLDCALFLDDLEEKHSHVKFRKTIFRWNDKVEF